MTSEAAQEKARLLAEAEDAWINQHARSSTRRFDLFCGKCRMSHSVAAGDIPDGEVWVCADCKPA